MVTFGDIWCRLVSISPTTPWAATPIWLHASASRSRRVPFTAATRTTWKSASRPPPQARCPETTRRAKAGAPTGPSLRDTSWLTLAKVPYPPPGPRVARGTLGARGGTIPSLDMQMQIQWESKTQRTTKLHSITLVSTWRTRARPIACPTAREIASVLHCKPLPNDSGALPLANVRVVLAQQPVHVAVGDKGAVAVSACLRGARAVDAD